MRHLVIVNQEANYLTTGLANAFLRKFDSVTLVTGVLHTQGEYLNPAIKIVPITQMSNSSGWRKAWSYLVGMVQIWMLAMTKFRNHEILFVSVPPMGYLLNLILPNRFSMVIWDLYPDVLKAVGMTERSWVYRLWCHLNRLSFRRAHRIFTIGDVLAEQISQYVHRSRIINHPIWSSFFESPEIPRAENKFIKEHCLEDRFVVQYSGNIGVTQNVDVILEIAECLQSHPRIVFQIIGRGQRLLELERTVKERALPNLKLLPFQTDSMFVHSLSAANLGVVVLSETVSRGSVPSKAYNLMNFGIPALYISSAESQLALDAVRYNHARCFASTDLESIVEFIISISEDRRQWERMSEAARNASRHFLPNNANLFVETYFK